MIGFINFNGGQYLLNGKDLYTEYGIIISAGKSDLLQYPSTKERFSNDWADQNGKEYDLDAPVYFNDPKITLKGIMLARTEVEFKNKRYNLFLELKSIGVNVLKSIDLDTEFNVLYEESPQGSLNVRVKGSDLKAWELSLVFQTIGYIDSIQPGGDEPEPPEPPKYAWRYLNLDGFLAEYRSSLTYTIGQVVWGYDSEDIYTRAYRSIADGNRGNNPLISPDKWQDIGEYMVAYISGATYKKDDYVIENVEPFKNYQSNIDNNNHPLDFILP